MSTQQLPVATGYDPSTVTARFFSGLADPTRLRIVLLLVERPRPVSEIVATLGLTQPRVSNALACLKWCGYVEARREGRQVWYAVADPRIRELVGLARAIMGDHADALASCTRLAGTETALPRASAAETGV
jgi:DNA-binding transcriptional ArsR family regulator